MQNKKWTKVASIVLVLFISSFAQLSGLITNNNGKPIIAASAKLLHLNKVAFSDNSGKFVFSNIVGIRSALNSSENISPKIYYNKNIVNILLPKRQLVNLSIFNLNGTIVQSFVKHLNKGNNVIPVSFADGCYLAKISYNDGFYSFKLLNNNQITIQSKNENSILNKTSAFVIDTLMITAEGYKDTSLLISSYSGYYQISLISELPAAPTGLATTTITQTSIELSWNSIPLSEYYVVFSSDDLSNTFDSIAKTTNVYYTNKNLLSGKKYYYYIVSVNSAGESSASSTVFGTTMPLLPASPSLNSVYMLNNAPRTIMLSWSTAYDTSIKKFNIYKNTALTGTFQLVGVVSHPKSVDLLLKIPRSFSFPYLCSTC